MIKIRQLTEVDMKQAMELRILCWTEELAGKAKISFTFKRIGFWGRLDEYS